MIRIEVTMPVVEAARTADLKTAIAKVREELEEVESASGDKELREEIADVAVAAFGMLIGQLGVHGAKEQLKRTTHKLHMREHFDSNYGR